MTFGFAVGPTHTGVGSVDIAQTVFIDCSALGCATGGYNVGNGTGGNILDTYFYGCNSQVNGSYGIYSTGTTWHWYGGTFQKNGYADIWLGNGSKIVSAQGFRGESSTRLLYSTGGGTCNVSLRDTLAGHSIRTYTESANGDYINYNLPGVLNLDNIQIQQRGCALTGGPPHPTALTVNVNGLAAEATINQLFSAGPTQFVTVNINGYVHEQLHRVRDHQYHP